MSEQPLEGIAIIGLHGRFPGADSVEEFWANLVAGKETISFFSDDELTASGLDPDALRRSGHYVPARGVLKDAEYFDAAFFGIHPKEAEVIDPQQRIFLEACWESLERAGYPPDCVPGAAGVYAGAMFNTYYLHALHPRPRLREIVGREQLMLGNEKDYIATRVAYKLNLKGPAISLNTGCSSSLVAVCQACQSLLTYQCDLALAGGVSVRVPQQDGYFHQEGNIASADGHTRAFDAAASGTVFSNGVTIVVLKRLEEALADGDKIYAVIKGSALNNDGAQRVSFGAPGVEGQSEVIALAQEIAGVAPDSISYIEAHGTATPIGDPIEVAALTKAFRRGTQRKQFCALGSVKSNIGHLDAAAGTAGLIKTALALEHHLLPPSLHFHNPNPKLDLENSPFFVNSTLSEWKSENGSRLLAGISSFGTGGTNAHIVVEEAPAAEASGPSRPWQLLLMSAKTPEALESATQNLAAHLKAHPDVNLADVAYTLQVGRSEFIHRRVVLCQTVSEAIALLETPDTKKVFSSRQQLKEPPVVFMFPGQGAQYVDMGAEVYRHERVFREAVDQCAQILEPILGADLRNVLFAKGGHEENANAQLHQTRFTQPALFTIEYALAKLWMAWGVNPAAMTGHSVGEYVAGCLADVFTLEEALTLVARRAELVQAQKPGSMLAVRLPEREIRPFLNGKVSIAAINSPNLCVVSGPHEAVAELEKEFTSRGVAAKALRTSHAFHSAMMEPVVEPFTDLLRKTRLMAPKIPYVSNVTGQWVTAEEATSPEYWAGHVRKTVRFADGAIELLKDPRRIMLEVGPGQTLVQLVRQDPARKGEQPVISTLSASRDQELPNLLAAVGRLWLAGAVVDWRGFYENESRRRVVLPTYPFERKRYWPESPIVTPEPVATSRIEPAPLVEWSQPGAAAHAEASAESGPAIAASAPSRKEHLTGVVRALVQDLSGTSLGNVEDGIGFLELGLDSLLLTQAATLVQRKFGVAISFRQLMESLSTIDSLATHLDEQLPAGSFEPVSAAAVPPVSAPISAQTPALAADSSPGALEQLLQQQLQMTTQLLAVVRGQHGTVPAIPATSGGGAMFAPAVTKSATDESKAHGPFHPMDRGGAEGLTERQQSMLDALIARYTKRTIGSKRLAEQNRPVLADPRTAAGFKQIWKEIIYPIYTVRSDGSKVWDVDGNEYVDFVMGFGASLFGHRPPFVVEAIKHQLELGFEIGPIQPMVGEAAALVRELTGMERVGFCNTGSEAVLAAIRVCRTVTGRDKIAMFAGAYHGIFDEVLARPLTVNGEVRAAPIAPGIPESAMGQLMVLDYGRPESLELIRRHGHELAAVLVEPVQSRRLDLQPREFLHELRRITEETGTALVFDEVVTGFRIHPGGAQAHFNIRADVATYGKVVGGGLPIGIVAGKPRFLDALDGGEWRFGDASFPEVGVTFFAGTFVRHPIAIAVAKAVLEHLRREGPQLQERLTTLAKHAAERVCSLIDRFQAPLRLTRFSSMMHLIVAPEFKHGGLVFSLLRERGIHIWENRVFIFTSAHTNADVDRLVSAFEQSLEELAVAGFIKAVREPAALAMIPREANDAGAQKKVADAICELPLTDAQREMWLGALMNEDLARAFNITFLIHLEGTVNRAALESAWQALVDRHDGLRTCFDRNSPVQRIHAALKLSIPFVDLTTLPAEQRERELVRLTEEQTNQSVDLTRAPLLYLKLVKKTNVTHTLILTLSHLIADGWSSGVLLHELKQLYGEYEQNDEPKLEPALQFADYAEFCNGQSFRESSHNAETYWKSVFRSPPVPLDLPTDRVRPPQKTYSSTREDAIWDADFTSRLRKGAAKLSFTLQNYLLAAFGVLMHRLAGQEDLVVGIPIAGQISPVVTSVPGHRALVGHCVNTLPLRLLCSGKMPFREFLKTVREQMLGAYEHQEMTYGSLLQTLRLSRDPSRAPIIPVLFNLDRAQTGFHLGGLKSEVEEVKRSALVFDIFINIVDQGSELNIGWEYNTDLFDAATTRRWISHYRTILESAMTDPEQGVDILPLVDLVERGRLLAQWNQTKAEYPRNKRVHALFEKQAARVPDAIAVEFGSDTLTYRELDHRANVLASELQKKGLKPEALVGVYVERSLDMVVGLLGIMKAGGAYVPLDPSFPKDRLAFMAADAQLPFLVTQHGLMHELPEHQARVVCVDVLDFAQPASPDLSAASASDLAYVLYTSGSTGRPKGVQISHRALVNFLYSMRREPGLREEDIFLAITTLSFDIAGLELFLPLITGAKVVIAPRDITVDGPLLAKLIASCDATAMQATPVTWRMLIDSDWQGDGRLKVLCGGEAFGPDLTEQLLKRCGELWNMYGPTETTIWSTIERLLPGQFITIGRPIANTQVYILDGNSQPVPAGVAGELFIGGDGVAMGYLNRPELTRERFVPNPLDVKGEDILYRTGDLARFRADGRIEFLGRGDHQVKIRGFRIELGEIEASLLRTDGVARAVVVARQDAPGDKRLVAYVVPKVSSSAPSVATLRAALRSHLPEYMMPSAFVFLEALPLTPNGKVDRKALPQPDHSSDATRSYEAPRGAIEEQLAGMVGSILNVPRVGREDSFFDLGGHSILAVTLFNEIDRVFGKRLPLATLFRSPTIEGLATALVSGRDRSHEWPSLIPIHPHGSKMRFFCVHGAGGNVLLYRDLARNLGTEYPFYGLQSQGLDGKALPLETVEAMAGKYLREIRGLQPEGPYCLGGYCLGGTIAYEIAQRLRADKQEVALVALLDTYNFARMERPRLLGYLWQKLEFHFGNLIRLPLSNWPGYFSNKLRVARDGELSSLWKALRGVLRANGDDPRSIEAGVQEVNDRAAEAYRPEPYAGRVTVFKPRVNYNFYPDPQMGWGDLVTGELDIIELPVNPHAMLVEPYVQMLSSQLREKLEKVTAAKTISHSHQEKMPRVVNGMVT